MAKKKHNYIIVWRSRENGYRAKLGYTTFCLDHKLKTKELNHYLDDIKEIDGLLLRPLLLNIIKMEG